MRYKILPSILSADMMHLADEVHAVIKGGADMIHFDVMDNHYVPNLTFGPIICKQMRQQFKTIPIDVHLMVSPVDELIQEFAKVGATRLSIHPDATIHLDRSLQQIKEMGCEAGLVLNPSTSIDWLTWCAHRLDFVLVMTVNPGFGGQNLIPEVIDKIKTIHDTYPNLPIGVDGGISKKNIAQLAAAGASQFVAGSAIFNTTDYASTIQDLRAQLNGV
ncbi:ribulose-phosphate 3-epimerase [Legionella impletisoli]|uniref:Ribulose-phosphate 3-epimerase n=1 Tax=Legionella impletisoli TaxID=343510 RepID=A0A917JRX7_9GAMM|nr:ribulose-phosphate 3-epimerase [Legionella impletisoli]GGI80848.1 ribulose-phosphate 3-epimerase [Legionella impletisoli]